MHLYCANSSLPYACPHIILGQTLVCTFFFFLCAIFCLILQQNGHVQAFCVAAASCMGGESKSNKDIDVYMYMFIDALMDSLARFWTAEHAGYAQKQKLCSILWSTKHVFFLFISSSFDFFYWFSCCVFLNFFCRFYI